jgi:hypothetical protein
MEFPRNLFYLAEEESEKTQAWISENRYQLSMGHFHLEFMFSPYGDTVELTYFKDDQKYLFEVRDVLDDPEKQKNVDHIKIDSANISLEVSEEGLKAYFKSGRELTEAHVNEDCEPPGYGLCFEIYHDRCNLVAGPYTIESRQTY